jgi:hypothetical protein
VLALIVATFLSTLAGSPRRGHAGCMLRGENEALSVRGSIMDLGAAEVGRRYVNSDFGWDDLGLAVFTGEDELG